MRADMPASLAHHLGDATLVDVTDLVGTLRLIKSPAEIDCLRRAALLTGIGVQASLDVIRPGILDNDVCRAGYDAMVGAGADFLSIQPIVTSGKRAGGFHQMHRRVPIEAGDSVFMEYGGCYKRYTAPMMRCAFLGEPDAEMRGLEEAVKATTTTIIDNARPGRIGHYTIGVGYPPTWADTIGFIHVGSDLVLQPGMTFHLPIGIRVPGRYGISLSESILITETGCEVLTGMPRELTVLKI